MITHEHDVAEYASRVVELRDGMIISDHAQRRARLDIISTGTVRHDDRPRRIRELMSNVLGNLVMAVRGIGSNWLRTLLTMLGVLIGVASVIVLLAIGTGSSQSIENSIQSLGSNTLTVFSGRSSGASSGTQIRNTTLNSASVIFDLESQQRP